MAETSKLYKNLDVYTKFIKLLVQKGQGVSHK